MLSLLLTHIDPHVLCHFKTRVVSHSKVHVLYTNFFISLQSSCFLLLQSSCLSHSKPHVFHHFKASVFCLQSRNSYLLFLTPKLMCSDFKPHVLCVHCCSFSCESLLHSCVLVSIMYSILQYFQLASCPTHQHPHPHPPIIVFARVLHRLGMQLSHPCYLVPFLPLVPSFG